MESQSKRLLLAKDSDSITSQLTIVSFLSFEGPAGRCLSCLVPADGPLERKRARKRSALKALIKSSPAFERSGQAVADPKVGHNGH